MIKLYICCLVLIIGSVEVNLDIDMKFHQEVMEIVSYDNHQPASHPGGGWEGSSIRGTSNLTPRQEGGHPTGVPCNTPLPSTPGKPLPQPGSITRASPRNPLKNLTHYRSAGWKKDLDHIHGSFYHYTFPPTRRGSGRS